MLIVAKHNSYDERYAIFDTVTEEFHGVELTKFTAVGIIMDVKGYKAEDFEKALSRVEKPQPFRDIAKYFVEELWQ